jgi:hypothetical protein
MELVSFQFQLSSSRTRLSFLCLLGSNNFELERGDAHQTISFVPAIIEWWWQASFLSTIATNFFTLGTRDGDRVIYNLSTWQSDSISAQRVKLQEKGKEMQLSSKIATTMAQFQNCKYLRSDTIRVSLVCIVTIPTIHSSSDTQVRSVPFFLWLVLNCTIRNAYRTILTSMHLTIFFFVVLYPHWTFVPHLYPKSLLPI